MKSRIAIVASLLVAAPVLGAVIALGDDLIFDAALGRTVGEVDVLVMNAVLAAVPFLFLAFFKPRLVSWLVALAATVAIHGWWLSKGIAYQKAPDGTGVPILGAVFMLFAPFVILLFIGILNGVMARRAAVNSPA